MIVFKNHRMRVGHRREDWNDVWYEPHPEGYPDEDDYIEMSLHKSPTGPPTPNEPMEGEVVWSPNFDIANCESKDRKERVRMHRITLYRAWKYLDETDPQEVDELEEKFDKPDRRRWQSWFTHAKKWKRTKIQGRKRKRKEIIQSKPVQVMLVDGTPLSELDITSDSEDSAYGSEAERLFAEEKKRKKMPPPSRSDNTSNRRGRGSSNSPDTRANSRKTRPKRKGRGKHSEDDTPPPMSGGLGTRDRTWDPRYQDNNGLAFLMNYEVPMFGSAPKGNDNTRPYQATVQDLTGDDDDDPADDDNMSVFDPRPPEGPSSNLFVTPQATSDRHGTTGPLGASRMRSAYTSVSPHGDYGNLGNGLSVHGARMMAARRSGSGNGSTAEEDETARPAQPPLGRSYREGSVFESIEHRNGGLDDDAAFAAAIRLSQMPDTEQQRHDAEVAAVTRLSVMPESEQERPRQAMRDSLEREGRESATAGEENGADEEEAEPGADAGDD